MSAATPKGNERLRTLYAIMGGVPDEKVDMDNWRAGAWEDSALIDTDCRTSACAVGWACAYPEFKAQGLSFDGAPLLITGRRRVGGWGAVEAFFGLDDEESSRLFSAFDSGKSARIGVMRRIRLLLLKRGVITKERSAELALEEARL